MLSACHETPVSLPAIFSDHAVLQKGSTVPIWGKAAPGQRVTVAIAGQTAEARASMDGNWETSLDLSKCGPGPYQMTVEGRNRLVIKDVVVGEVWLASGQSNMESHVNSSDDAVQEIAQSENPMLRQFSMEKKASPGKPLTNFGGRWRVAKPRNTPEFSAVGYYFGKKLQKDLGVPVGILNCSYSGAYCETWISQKSLNTDPDLKKAQMAGQEYFDAYPALHKAYADAYREWAAKYGREDHPVGKPEDFAAPAVSTGDWKTLQLPGPFTAAGMPDAGVTWLRKEITVNPSSDGKNLRIDLGNIRRFTTIYWNGTRIGETTCETERRTEKGRYTYEVPARLVKTGTTVLAIRVFSPEGNAGLSSSFSGDGFRVVDDYSSQFLAGNWLAKAEYAMPEMEAAAARALPVEPEDPLLEKNLGAALFNGMIHPLLRLAIRGVISYQGESNASFAVQYRTTFPLLIKDWREQWNRPDLPFYFCQVANFGPKHDTPTESMRAELREAQTMTLALPHTGQAVLIDIGEEKDDHPRNKKEVGERLARLALAGTYGEDIPYSGPVCQSMQVEGSEVRIKFAHADGGLVAQPLPARYQPRSSQPETAPLIRNSPGSQLEGFAICGENRKWVWADARIDGDSVVVWSKDVPAPVAVRYAWAENPTCNLYNGAGLPANPFRTDDYPVTSRKRTK